VVGWVGLDEAGGVVPTQRLDLSLKVGRELVQQGSKAPDIGVPLGIPKHREGVIVAG
jgi:hypothetical protein